MNDEDNPDSLDNILNIIKQLNCPAGDIITWRGILAKIMLMPYY